jgi:DNA polymerase-3 subunit epsilon
MYVIIDIETTGGSPKSSKITEVAIYKHDGEKIIDEYSTLINPGIKIPEFIVRLTGINNAMVENSPIFSEVAAEIVDFTADCVFVAHNVGFDYGVLRAEFKKIGIDYRRPHLCTVRSSRHIIPGYDSYSLGRLSDSLGIEIQDRHRAGGDALATAKLFTLLMDKDTKKLTHFIQAEINPKMLHPQLSIDSLDDIPNKTGVYRFYNEFNQLICVGKSKQLKSRIEHHLRNGKTKKGVLMMREIARIEHEITGSELIALLKEASLIKEHKPIFNTQVKKNRFPFGLYDYVDENGYIRLYIGSTAKKAELPLANFVSKKEAYASLELYIERYQLCQKLCNLYPANHACLLYDEQQCNGACIQEEEPTEYNRKVNQLIKSLTLTEESFYILEKGRLKSEKSIIMLERGEVIGFGYAPYHFSGKEPLQWKRFIKYTMDDHEMKTILSMYMRKASRLEIIHF